MAKYSRLWYNIGCPEDPRKSMNILTRQQVLEQISSAAAGEDETSVAGQLAAWAFDQFYAEEAGAIAFEPGYRHAIGAVLDDLMFSDQPGFHLSAPELRQIITHLEQAEPTDDDEEDDDESDADD